MVAQSCSVIVLKNRVDDLSPAIAHVLREPGTGRVNGS